MIWVAGPDKQVAFFNRTCLEFSGRTMEEKLGEGWIAGLHPEDQERFLGVFSSSFEFRKEFREVCRLRRADGEYRWVLCTGAPRFEAGDVFSGFIGSCIDITDQKLIEERLRDSETELKEAQRLARIGSWERQIDDDTIRWSEGMLRIFGQPETPPSNLWAFLTYVHPHDREKILQNDARVRSNEGPAEVEFRIVRPDGEVRYVRSVVQAIGDKLGEPARIVGTTQDVTEQVKARELLRESEEHLKYAERIAHIGHWQWDIRTNSASGSEEMNRIFGTQQDHSAKYEDFLRVVAPEDKKRVDRAFKDSLAAKKGSAIEYRMVRPDGDVRTISCIWEVLLDESGWPERLFGTCQDITDFRREQEESIARQKLESVGVLASGIAHDFNNLLGGVLAQSELALAECAAGRYPEEELKGIRKVAVRASEIVRQLMIYAGRESATTVPVDLSTIVKEMLELLKVSVSKRAALESDLSQNLPPVRANAAELRQLVMNLVTNASDAIGERDGVIRVTTRYMQIRPTLGGPSDRLGEGNFVQLEVSDTGSGMPPEVQARVFDPFFTTKPAGHGLGLAIVQGIVHGLGGRILLSSEPGKGTTFQILLPCAETTAEAVSEPAASLPEAVTPSHDPTLLVVEDEGPLRQAVVRVLRQSGFSIVEAADGSSALELFRACGSRIDAILLDMTIPGISSEDIVAEAAKIRPDIRVILTSAYSQETIRGTMNLPQIRAFIRKPFQLGDLLKTLRATLSP
jgi:PAS domain S-box-containing protein